MKEICSISVLVLLVLLDFTVVLSEETDAVETRSQSVSSFLKPAFLDTKPDLILTGPTESYTQYGNYPRFGDVNGDGYEDLLVAGASRYNNNQGRVYLYYGGTYMDDIADIILTGENSGDDYRTGENPGDYFGEDACLADVNGDNYADIITGAFGYNKKRGRVYIYFGGPSMDENADLIIEGEAGTQGAFGLSMTAGDFNDDGYDDVVVCASSFNNKTGRVYLFYGGDPMDTTVDLIFDGENENDRFGRDINNPKMVGDVNGDGYNDLLISTRTWNYWEGVSGQGRAYLYYGGPGTSMDTTCDKIFTGENERDDFGVAGCIFDIDNDGFDDVIIGARRYNGPRGRVYLYWGGKDMDTIADLTFDGEGGSFGCGLDAGYVNGDVYGDFIVAAPYYGGKPWSGKAYLFYGDTKARINTTCDKTFTLPTDSDNRPQHVALGDLRNDNYPEVAIGGNYYNNGQGRVWIYFNKPPGSTDELPISLQEATSAGKVDEVEALISKGVDVNAREYGSLRTALHYAAEKGHKEIAELLIAKGADVNAKKASSGDTPLHSAARAGHKDIVELLVEKGAVLPSIHEAARFGVLAGVKAFLEQGVDVNTQDDTGFTPLHYSVVEGYKELAEFLIAKGADVNSKDKSNYTSLYYAIWGFDNNIAKLLIEKGADVHGKDQSGYTPLHWAVMMGNKELTELVLAKGADVNARGEAGTTPLDFAIYGGKAIGQLLVEKGAEAYSLQAAAFIGDLDKVKSFIGEGADVNKKDVLGGAALHAAAAGGQKNIAELLIVKGADINASLRNGQTPLHSAAGRGHRDIVELLISKGADANAKDKRGRSPLSLAEKGGYTEIADLLRKHIEKTKGETIGTIDTPQDTLKEDKVHQGASKE